VRGRNAAIGEGAAQKEKSGPHLGKSRRGWIKDGGGEVKGGGSKISLGIRQWRGAVSEEKGREIFRKKCIK